MLSHQDTLSRREKNRALRQVADEWIKKAKSQQLFGHRKGKMDAVEAEHKMVNVNAFAKGGFSWSQISKIVNKAQSTIYEQYHGWKGSPTGRINVQAIKDNIRALGVDHRLIDNHILKEETRTCFECEKHGVAEWKCALCDNSLYCGDCNSAVHRARVMAKHKRTKLPPVPRCGECESKTACVCCEQCEVPLCATCDANVHKFKSLRRHTRVKLSGKTEKAKPKISEPKVAKKMEKEKKKTRAGVQANVVELSSGSESELESDSEDEAPFEPAAKPTSTPARKPTLIELSSQSENDSDDEVLLEQRMKPTSKTDPAKSSFGSSSGKNKTPAKAKRTPVIKKEVISSSSSSSDSSNSSSSDSSSSSEDEAPPAKTVAGPTPTPRRPPAPARSHKAGFTSKGSSHTLVMKIEAFNESGKGDELHLDANLNSFERLLAHDCAGRLGLAHESIGSGLERHIVISRYGEKRAAVNSGHGHKSKKRKHHRFVS